MDYDAITAYLTAAVKNQIVYNYNKAGWGVASGALGLIDWWLIL